MVSADTSSRVPAPLSMILNGVRSIRQSFAYSESALLLRVADHVSMLAAYIDLVSDTLVACLVCYHQGRLLTVRSTSKGVCQRF